MTLALIDNSVSDLVAYAGGKGHPDHPCLSVAYNPTSCIPCRDFSPWLLERVRRGDAEGLGEYLCRVREANPGGGDTPDARRAHYDRLASAILNAPLDKHIACESEAGYQDLRTALVLLAAHEVFSGVAMTGAAADYLAAVMAPHPCTLLDAAELVRRRNAFVAEMATQTSYWASWPELDADSLRSPSPPRDSAFQEILGALAELPLGSRAHAADALRYLSTPGVPRTLASLTRFEIRRLGLDPTESTRRILETGLVVPATDLDAWLAKWTRRDLLGFLAEAGVRVRNSWSKERLVEIARVECGDALISRMKDSGTVELSPRYATTAPRLPAYLDEVRETWRVWLAFGTGVE